MPELIKSEMIKSERVTSLNNSRYLLVGLPTYNIPVYFENLIFDLGLEGYVVILAHPERNECIVDNPNILYHMIEHGVLVQLKKA